MVKKKMYCSADMASELRVTPRQPNCRTTKTGSITSEDLTWLKLPG